MNNFDCILVGVLSLLLSVPSSKCDYIPKWSCDFENGICHWLQSQDDLLDFRHVKGSDISSSWQDHTKKSTHGKFLYLPYLFNDGNYNRYKSASLMSPVLMPGNGSCTMVLHYRVVQYHSSDRPQIFVYMVTKQAFGGVQRKLLFQSSTESGWIRKDLSFQSNVEFQVEISGVFPADNYGEIGIDDILFTDGCMTNEISPIRLVKIWTSPTHNYPAGVFYEKINGSWSIICSKDKARAACNLLGLKDVSAESSVATNGNLKLGQTFCLPNNITVPTSKTCNNASSCKNATFWECRQDYISMCPTLTHKQCTSAVKYPVCVSHNQMCDFVNNCPGGEDESNCLAYNRCNFQTDLCDWTASKNTVFEWRRLYDHGLGKYYASVNNYHAHDVTDVASLKLNYKIEGTPSTTCSLRFTYKIERISGGALRIVIKENGRRQTVWSMSARSYLWYRETFTLPHNRSLELLFEAVTTSSGGYGEFRLANVSFSKDCKFANHTYSHPRNDSSIFICNSGEAVDKKFVCDFKADCFDGSDETNCAHLVDRCNFESESCNWRIADNVPEKLRRWRGRTPSRYTGPRKDHTNKFISGYYVHLEASRREEGTYGHLVSRTMQRSLTNKCTLRWFYHMYSLYSYSMGKLSIIYKDISNQSERVLWRVQGDQGNAWKYGSVTFDITSFLYKIIFKAERGRSYMSDIAIDDVSFAEECTQIQDFEPISISKVGRCYRVETALNGSTASIFTLGWQRSCSLTIRTDWRLRISLYAEYLQAVGESVTIDAGNNGSVFYGGNFTGSLQPFALISSQNIIKIRVPHSYAANSHLFTFNITSTDAPAHAAQYKIPSGAMRIDFSRECGRYTERDTFYRLETVRPRTNGGRYYDNERCIYKFFTSNGYRIKFQFTSFETEKNYDYVQILNNGIISEQSRFSGQLDPFSFISKRSYLEFLFQTDSTIEKSGFTLEVVATSQPATAPHSPSFTTYPPPVWTTPSYYTTPWYPWRTTQRILTTPARVMTQNCYPSSAIKYYNVDNQFGEIDFNFNKSQQSTAPSSCSWTWYGSHPSMVEFQRLDNANYIEVTIDDSTYKKTTIRGNADVRHLDLIKADRSFTIKIFAMDAFRPKMLVKFSAQPGCYSASLRYNYKYMGKYTYLNWRNIYPGPCFKDYKYVFVLSDGSYYCSLQPPSYYSHYLQHPDKCSSCNILMSYMSHTTCQYGHLITNIELYSQFKRDREYQFERSRDDKRRAKIVISFAVVIPILLVCLCVFIFVKKKKKQATRQTPITPAASRAVTQRQPDPSVYFCNTFPPPETLPSYEDATKNGVSFFNTVYGQQTVMLPAFGNAPASFNDMPPEYAEIANMTNNSTTASPLRTEGLVKCDLFVALPGVELPSENDRPSSSGGRPPSRGLCSHSMTSLRSETAARSSLIDSPIDNSTVPASLRAERGSNEGEREMGHDDRRRRREERRRNADERAMNEAEVHGRRNRNHARDLPPILPPIQRVRAYENSAMQE